MADKVIIDTEIDATGATRGAEEVQAEIDKVIKQQDKLQAKFDKFMEVNGNKDSKVFKSMQYDAWALENKLYDLQDELARAKQLDVVDDDEGKKDIGIINKIKTAVGKLSNSLANLKKNTKKSNNTFKDGIKHVLKYGLGIASIYRLMNKIRSDVGQGINKLVQVDAGTNKAMTELNGSLSLLKNSLATAFNPILQAVVPTLTVLIDKISSAVTWVGKLISALAGNKTFTQAKKVLDDYAKSMANAGKSTKNTLASFDEINTLDSGNGGGGGEGATPQEMFDTVEIESNILGFAERVQEMLAPIQGMFATLFGFIDFSGLLSSFQGLWTAIQPFITLIGNGILWIVNNVLGPLAKFTISNLLPAWFDVLSSAVTLVTSIFSIFGSTFQNIWDTVLSPFADFIGQIVVGLINDLGGIISDFTAMFVEHGDSINTVLEALRKIVSVVGSVVMATISMISGTVRPFVQMIINGIGSIMDVFAGLVEFLSGAFTLDWNKALNGLLDIGRGIVNLLIDIVEGVLNTIIGGLNMLSVTVPDWVPAIGGSKFGFNLPTINWPRLAEGTVVPRTAKEFGAILGDNNQETEVVSPLSTMKQAMLEALSESGMGAGETQVNVYLEGDAKGLFRVVRTEANNYFSRTGSPAFNG